MRKLSFFAIIAFAIILTSTVSVTAGFAKTFPPNATHATSMHQDSAVLQSVSAPLSANCLSLGLVPDGFTGKSHGLAVITSQSVFVRVENAAPNTIYTVSVGYLKSNGCNGTWKSAGSIYTDKAGNGFVATHLKLSSNEYLVELEDGNGNVAYATSFMSM